MIAVDDIAVVRFLQDFADLDRHQQQLGHGPVLPTGHTGVAQGQQVFARVALLDRQVGHPAFFDAHFELVGQIPARYWDQCAAGCR